MPKLGKLDQGNGILSAGVIARIPIPPAYVGGTISIHVLNFAAPINDTSHDAMIETWISESGTAPGDADRMDINILTPTGTYDRDCALVSGGEYVYIRSSRADVSFRVSGILEDHP